MKTLKNFNFLEQQTDKESDKITGSFRIHTSKGTMNNNRKKVHTKSSE